jgi:hypothetical protein
MNKGLIQILEAGMRTLSDRQLMVRFGIAASIADTYKAPHALRGTPAKAHKTSKQVKQSIIFGAHKGRASIQRRLFA